MFGNIWKVNDLKDIYSEFNSNKQNIIKFRFFEFETDGITTNISEIFNERSEK